jgi:hypothetical protein
MPCDQAPTCSYGCAEYIVRITITACRLKQSQCGIKYMHQRNRQQPGNL